MLLQDHTKTIDACRFCFMCRHVCTVGVVGGKESDNPRGRGLILSKIQRGYVQYTDELVDTVYRCCLCGLCQAWCKASCTPPAAVLAARADIVALDKAPARARAIRDNLVQTGNPFGLPAEDRFKAIEQRDVFKKKAEVLYFVGCDAAYQQPEIANAFIKILKAAGVDFSLLADERSTGKPLTLLGYRDDAAAFAKELAKKIRATKCKVLVTTCPSSFDAFKKDFPAAGIELAGIEVLHASQYLDRLIKEKRLKFSNRSVEKTTLLDGTYLGRDHSIYDEPRKVLAKAAKEKPREMVWTRQFAHACGESGGVFKLMYPELSIGLAERVLAQAVQCGAEVMATTCPASKNALLAAKSTKVKVRDLVEIVADSL